jgi:hypothetical protein
MNTSNTPTDPAAMLATVYEEVMWLARRPNTSPSAARAWYTHIASFRLRRYLRRFSGQVSRRALEPGAVLRLEHFKRLQTTLTTLVAEHVKRGIPDPQEFVRIVTECEQVHIVTFLENYEARKAGGDYLKAGILLLDWKDVAPDVQRALWTKMLRGRVSNAPDFKPGPEHWPNPQGRANGRQPIPSEAIRESLVAAPRRSP